MTDLAFAGYRSYAATPDDPLRLKWESIKGALCLTEGAASRFAGLTASALNLAVNRRIRYQREPDGSDVWQKPMDTFRRGCGDCEDFAILKYALLDMAGVVVRLIIGEIKSISGNQPHAWCAAHVANEWHALDQRFDQLIPVSEYINWLPIAAMHDDQVVRFGQEFSINERLKQLDV